LSPAAPRLFTA